MSSQHSDRRAWSKAGFTLAEVLVGLMLSLLTLGVILSFNDYQLRVLADQASQVDLQSSARSIVDLLAREIRRAGVTGVSCGINFAYSDKVEIVTPDGTLAYGFGSRVIWRREGTGREEVLIDDVDTTGSRFRYFAADGTELTPADNATQRDRVRRIQIQVSLSDHSEMQGSASTNVSPRNRSFMGVLNVPACT